MALRYEAWSTPWDPGGFHRKVSMLPTIDGSGQGSKGFLSFPGDSSVDLSLAWFDRLDELVSDSESSLITVYDCDHDGTNTIIDEWILDRVPSHLKGDRSVSLSGGGLLSAFEKALVYAFDYPKNPASQGDHVWGGDNILANPDFENVSSSPKQVELVVTATGGTYTITAAGDTTSAIAVNAQAQTVEQRIQEDIAAINDIIVVQTSNSPRTFLIEMVDPLFGINFSVNTGSLTGGTATMTGLDDGGDEITAWTRAATLIQGIHEQGNYDTWQLSSTQNHTPDGKYSLFIDPGFVGATSNRLGGAQQVVNVIPGQVYQASIWVRPTQSDIRIRLGLFGVGEEVIVLSARQGETFPANTWNQISIPDIVMPDGVNRVIFRVACTNIGPTDPGGFFVDDAALLEGLVPTTIGDIWQTLLDDCTLDHAGDARGTILEWVDYSSFDAVNDSNGTPWNHDDLSFVARWGSNMFHVLDDTFTRGYEAELVRKATPTGGKTHDFHLYNPGGRDDNPSTAIHTGQPLTGGDALHRNPSSTAVLVVGENGEFTEDTDAPSLASFGRLEAFISDNEASGSLSRQLLADNLFVSENANRRAVSFNVLEARGVPRPGVHYRLGDTIPMTMAPTLTKEDRRVQRYDYVNTQPTQYVVVGSRVLQGEAAAFDLIGRMWRRMNRPGKFEPKPAGPLPDAKGGAPTVVIAPENASDLSKSKADFVCNGVDDHLVIQDAINSLVTFFGARILLAEGQFNGAFAGSPNVITTINPITIEGMGTEGTVFNVTDSFGGTPQDRAVFRLGGPDSYIKGLTIQGGDGSSGATNGIYLDGANSHVRDVGLFTDGVGVIVADGFCSVESSQFGNNGNGVEAFADHSKIIGNHFNTGGRGVVLSNNTTGFMVVSNNTFSHVSGPAIASDVFDGIHHSLISGNVIDRAGAHGIILNDSSDNMVQGNLLVEVQVGATNNTYDGIILTGNSNNNLIKGNKVISRTTSPRTRYGINVADATCNGNALIHNDLRPSSDFGTDDLNDNGTDTVFHGNVGDGGVGGGDPSASQSSKVVFSQAGVLSVGSGTFKLPFTLDAEIISVLLAVAVSPTGANLIADVNKNGTTIFTTQANRPTVPDGDANGVGAEAVPDVTTISEGDYLTVDIDQVGSTVAGEDLTVAVEWRPA